MKGSESIRTRSFRLSRAQGEILEVILLYFIDRTEATKEAWNVHREQAKKLLNQLKNYEWRTEK